MIRSTLKVGASFIALAMMFAACSQPHTGPKPEACAPAAMPSAKASDETEATYRFRIARGCVDRAALNLSAQTNLIGEIIGPRATAACATEIRGALLARSQDPAEHLMFETGVPYSGTTWETYAKDRIETFRSVECS